MNSCHFITISQALKWINNIASTATIKIPNEHKLDKITRVLELLQDPHLSYKTIHITGTKGKTSTAHACAYFLHKAHHKVGLFTSPHIHTYNERIRINNVPIDDTTLLWACNTIYPLITAHNIALSMFEIFTASAALIFKEQQVDYAIFEVGIGGTYDTTNLIQPTLSIITNIEKDHTNILGKTIQEITYNKAGIIKPHTPVFVFPQHNKQVLPILANTAKQNNAPLYNIDHYVAIQHSNITPYHIQAHIHINTQYIESHATPRTTSNPASHNAQDIFMPWNNVRIDSKSISPQLLENQIFSDIMMQYLIKNNNIPKSNTYPKAIQVMCRSELLTSKHNTNKQIFLDGAHTPESIKSAMLCISKITKTVNLIMGFSNNKNITEIAELLVSYQPIIHSITLTQSHIRTPHDPQILYNTFIRYLTGNISIERDLATALEHAYNDGNDHSTNTPIPLTGVLGSFFLCAESREWWNKNK